MNHVHDVYFTYANAAVWGTSALVYLARGATAPSARVEAIGGTALLGKGIMNWTYWMTDPVVRALAARDVSANALTWTSLVLGVGAGCALAAGWFGLACLLATCSTIGDILDGQVARHTHTGSPRGELLDAAVDRYTELVFIAGMVVYFHDSIALVILALVALQACVMISYASAKAEALQVAAPRGLMRRHERAAYLLVGVGLTPLFGDQIAAATSLPRETLAIAALALVGIVGNISAVQRFVRVGKALR